MSCVICNVSLYLWLLQPLPAPQKKILLKGFKDKRVEFLAVCNMLQLLAIGSRRHFLFTIGSHWKVVFASGNPWLFFFSYAIISIHI